MSGSERGDIEIHRFRVWAASLQRSQRNIFALNDLPHVIFENDLNHGVSYRLVAGIGDGAVNVADSCANKILGRLGASRRSKAITTITARTDTTATRMVRRLESLASVTGDCEFRPPMKVDCTAA